MKGSDCLGNYTFDHGHWEIWRDKYQYDNKGLCREKNDITAACWQGKVDQEYIKSKCRHNIFFDTLYIAHLSYFTISC